MFAIVKKETLSTQIKRMEILCPQVAKKASAGQFIVIKIDETSERIPLTIADWDRENETITIIFQEVGFSTKSLGQLEEGDFVNDILGPLGIKNEIENIGEVIVIGGGVGIAEIYPIVKAYKEKGNVVTTIIGARTKELLILEDELKKFSDKLVVMTDDGSYGQQGFVTTALKDLISKSHDYKLAYATGPVPMMKAVSEATRQDKIKTVVSLNPIMLDATGMCGTCRVEVGGKTLFACVDGPEFDGHLVDFNELITRLSFFKKEEECLNKKCPSKQ